MTSFSTQDDRISSRIALGFDDVMLEPAAATPLDTVRLKGQFSTGIALHIPFISAPAITDLNTAIHMAQQGGIGIVSGDMPISKQSDLVRQVKRYQARMISNLVMITPEMPIIEALEYKHRYNISLMPVVEGGTNLLAGFLELDDTTEYDAEHSVSHYISATPFTTLPVGTDMDDINAALNEQDVKYIAITDAQQRCVALVTAEDREKIARFPNATMDENGSLRVAAMVGTSAKEYDRVNALMDAGADAIIVYAGHGHSKELSDIVTHIRRQRSARVEVIAGNITTEQAALAAIDAGANGLYIGHNPEYDHLGMGTTMLQAILDVTAGASLHNVPVIVEQAPPIAHRIKAFAAGASGLVIDTVDDASHTMEPLRKALSYTGSASLQDFASRSRFTRLR